MFRGPVLRKAYGAFRPRLVHAGLGGLGFGVSCFVGGTVFCNEPHGEFSVVVPGACEEPTALSTMPQSYESPNASVMVRDRILPLFDDPSVEKGIFAHITDEYDALGQVERDEVAVTVQPHVFSQIGVIDKVGIRALSEMILRERAFVDGTTPVVLCDIGSGVGNVLMQFLGEVPQCRRVVGVEIIPSRHRMAVAAFENAKALFPRWYCSSRTELTTTTLVSATTHYTANTENPTASTSSTSTSTTSTIVQEKGASFHMVDLVGAGKLLETDGVNVIFSHSWMFDDDLMVKFADTVATAGEQMQLVFTSRPFMSPGGHPLLPKEWSCAGVTTLSADWNPKSPFYVYVRRAV